MALLVFTLAWLAGLVGTFVPVLPSTLIVFLGALLAAWIGGFERLTWSWLLGALLLTVFAGVVDNVAGAWGARRYGGSKAATWGALAGGVAGLFLPFGLLIGPPAGALLAELVFVRRPLMAALRSTWGTFVGLLAGVGAKFVLNVLLGLAVLWRLAT